MSYAAAKIHESSEEHVLQIEQWDLKNSWGVETGDCQWGQWEVNHSEWTALSKADKMNLIVEYWYKGVQAANRGEELKFELFLETLEG